MTAYPWRRTPVFSPGQNGEMLRLAGIFTLFFKELRPVTQLGGVLEPVGSNEVYRSAVFTSEC